MTIERIETSGPDSRARRLVFSEPVEPRITSASAVRALHLEEGREGDTSEIEQALAEVEPRLAKERALRYLGYRDRSLHEVRRRLLDDGYPSHVADAVCARLVELSLLDDERFAVTWARSRIRAGYGTQRIAAELARRGVAGDTVAAALAAACDEQDPVARAREVLAGRMPATRAERDRALRKLVRRGFDLATALRALEPSDSVSE